MLHIALLLITALLVLLNGFFVAAEFGLVKLRHTRVAAIQSVHGYRGKILSKIHGQLDLYLSACQLGITFASLGLGWIGEPAIASLLESVLGSHFSLETIEIISFAIAFGFLSFLHIVIGELIPKSLAIRSPETISVWSAVPLYAFYWIMYPAIWLLNSCANLVLKLAGLHSTHDEQQYSTEEIKLILSSSHSHGELTKEETNILHRVLEFADLKMLNVMRPATEIIKFSDNLSVEESIKLFYQYKYSRYPVYDNNTQEITGIIHVKDLFLADKNKLLKDLQRPIFKIAEDQLAIGLLELLRERMTHFALVYNNKNYIIGFVTFDNLLHILLGRIKDEFH